MHKYIYRTYKKKRIFFILLINRLIAVVIYEKQGQETCSLVKKIFCNKSYTNCVSLVQIYAMIIPQELSLLIFFTAVSVTGIPVNPYNKVSPFEFRKRPPVSWYPQLYYTERQWNPPCISQNTPNSFEPQPQAKSPADFNEWNLPDPCVLQPASNEEPFSSSQPSSSQGTTVSLQTRQTKAPIFPAADEAVLSTTTISSPPFKKTVKRIGLSKSPAISNDVYLLLLGKELPRLSKAEILNKLSAMLTEEENEQIAHDKASGIRLVLMNIHENFVNDKLQCQTLLLLIGKTTALFLVYFKTVAFCLVCFNVLLFLLKHCARRFV